MGLLACGSCQLGDDRAVEHQVVCKKDADEEDDQRCNVLTNEMRCGGTLTLRLASIEAASDRLRMSKSGGE